MQKQEINNAISEHAMWKFNLEALIRKGRVDIPVKEATDTECEFGKWFYGPAIVSRHKATAQYKTVKKLHIAFHAAAAKVAEAASNGKAAEAEEMMATDGEFTRVSNELMEALHKWRDSACK